MTPFFTNLKKLKLELLAFPLLALRSIFLVGLVALTVTGCGRGARDSLLLTGLRDRPDESKIQTNDVLAIPKDDRVVAPNAPTQISVKRSNVFKVNSILFGEDIASDEAERQLDMAEQNAFTPTEAQLLKHAYGVTAGQTANAASRSPEKERKWWQIRIPKVFGRN